VTGASGPVPAAIVGFEHLAARALDGEASAWEALVDRLSGVVWRVLGSYRLRPADREDAYASTFYRLYDKLGTVTHPEALPGWIATTARNEVHALLRAQGRLLPMGELPLHDPTSGDVDASLLDDELGRAVLTAFHALPAKGQALLRLLTTVPPLSYEEIGRLLDMPHGSIGPTRARYLAQLRRALQSFTGGDR
jgi:RNA polymerase sigma factor (sigma-70 family)